MKSNEDKPHWGNRIGLVTARTCPTCGHHEIGYTSPDGIFHPLKPGTLVKVLEGDDIRDMKTSDGFEGPDNLESVCGTYIPWVPEQLMGNKELRMKYGVMVGEGKATEDMSPEAYHEAYMEKLYRLIDREEHAAIAIGLDRYFTASHLASGHTIEIANALWRELDEIRQPVRLLTEWIEKKDEESLKALIHPKPLDTLMNDPVTHEQFRQELEDLTLEEFLELL
jgi:hypothetical protein